MLPPALALAAVSFLAQSEGSVFVPNRVHIGETFARTTWRGWLLLLAGIFAGVVAGQVAKKLMQYLAKRFAERDWRMQGTVVLAASGPAHLALITIGAAMGMSAVFLTPALELYVGRTIALLYAVALGWLLYGLVDIVDLGLRRLVSKTDSHLDDQVVPLVRKSLRIFLVIVFALFIAENIFGANIGAWLAGLGIAGLAVSLAAQDSIKNLFGSITILFDRPFTVGDRIIFDSFDGEVVEIGFRSTKIRTAAGEVVTIPNAKIVDGSVNNVTRRPFIFRNFDVTLKADTSPDQMQRAVQIVRDILAEPDVAAKLDPDRPPRVAFMDLNADHLAVRVWYWFKPPDWWDYTAHTEQFNLKLMRRYAEAGLEFSFPTRALVVAGDPDQALRVSMVGEDGHRGGPRRGAGDRNAQIRATDQ